MIPGRSVVLNRSRAGAVERRHDRGVTTRAITLEAQQAVLLNSIHAISTEHGYARELKYFREFLEELDAGEASDRAVIQKWSGGMTIDQLFQRQPPPPQLIVGIVHAYLYWRAGGSYTTINHNKSGMSTISSLQNAFDVFWSGYLRATQVPQNFAIYRSGMAYIESTLKDKLGLTEARRERRTPDSDVLFDILQAIWNPNLPYTKSIVRINTMTVLNIQGGSAGRIGSIIRSGTSGYGGPEHDQRGLCWVDLKLWLGPGTNSKYNDVLAKIFFRFGKTKESRNRTYDLRESNIPGLNAPMLLLTLAVGEGVLVGDPTLQQVLSPAFLRGRKSLLLAIKPGRLNEPILRSTQPNINGQDSQQNVNPITRVFDYSVPNKIWDSPSYDGVLRAACTLAGYPVHFASHDMRSAVVQASVKSGLYQIQEIQHGIGHSVLTDTWTVYMQGTNSVNFQAALFTGATFTDTLAQMSQMRLERVPGLQPFLSKAGRETIVSDPEIIAIQSEQDQIASDLRAQYGTLSNAPAEAKVRYKELAAKGRSVYNALYRIKMREETKQYFEEHGTSSGLASMEAADEAIKQLDVGAQVDAMPSSKVTDDSISGGLAGLVSIDFERPIEVLQTLGDPQTVIEAMRDSLAALDHGNTSGRSPDARPAARPVTNTASQVLMPPPPAQSSKSVSPEKADIRSTRLPDAEKSSSDSPTMSATPPSVTPSSGKVNSFGGMPLVGRREHTKFLAGVAAPAPRGRSTSAESSTSTSSSTPTTNGSDKGSTESDSSVSSIIDDLDTIQTMVLDPGADKLFFFSTLLKLPSTSTSAAGWWPGMVMVRNSAGQDSCPRCYETMTDIVAAKGHQNQILSHRTNDMRLHVYTCTQASITAKGIDEVLERFDQGQLCPACDTSGSGRNDTVDEDTEQDTDVSDDEDDTPGPSTRAAIKPKWASMKTRTRQKPYEWLKHLESHPAGTICSCGWVFTESQMQCAMHLATAHRIWASRIGNRSETATEPDILSPQHMPPARYSLTDYAWYIDPVDWEHHCQQNFEQVINNSPGQHTFFPREDLFLKKPAERAAFARAIASLDIIVSPSTASEHDNRFQPVVAIEHIAVPVRYGHCIWCAFDTSLTYTDRMPPISSAGIARAHHLHHLLDLWSADHPEHKVPNKSFKKAPSTRPLAAPNTHGCPDPHCSFASANMRVWELSNHIVVHHACYTNPDPLLLFADDEPTFACNLLSMCTSSCVKKGTIDNTGLPKYVVATCPEFGAKKSSKKRKSESGSEDLQDDQTPLNKKSVKKGVEQGAGSSVPSKAKGKAKASTNA